MKRVLIAIDGSVSALNAAKYGIAFSEDFKFEIGIAEITNYAIGNIDAGVLPYDVELANQKRAKKHINEIRLMHPGMVIKEFLPIGNPDIEIMKIIKFWKADLLVIGHHTHNMLHRIFMNSLETRLINAIDIPLLIVPEKFS